MNARRASRGWALLIAVGLQVLIVVIFTRGFGLLSRPQAESAMAVSLLPPPPPRIREVAATLPLGVKVRMADPGLPPSVPVDIIVPAPPELLPIPTDVPLIARDSAGAATGRDSGINILSEVKADYSLDEVIRGVQGTTEIAVLVNADGHLAGIKVLHSSGDEALDKTVVSAVRKWKFAAATTNSGPVPSWGRLQVDAGFTVHAHQSQSAAVSRKDANGEEAKLRAVINAWGERRSPALLNPALTRLLKESGPVQNIRFLGGALTPPESLVASNSQALRLLDITQLARWDTFEVSQQRATSQWYCAVDTAGRIQAILLDGG